MTPWLLEALGYLASLLVAISLMMRSVLRLRVINLLGSICFSIYGLLIGAYPVAIVNAIIALINVYYLVEMLRTTTYFTVLDVDPDSAYLDAFLRYYANDMRSFYPQGLAVPAEGQVIWLILRNLVPVGLFIAERSAPDRLSVLIDYVIPGYRDLQPGTFLYTRQADRFKAMGVRWLCSAAPNAMQRKYLVRMGFAPAQGGDPAGLYCRSVQG